MDLIGGHDSAHHSEHIVSPLQTSASASLKREFAAFAPGALCTCSTHTVIALGGFAGSPSVVRMRTLPPARRGTRCCPCWATVQCLLQRQGGLWRSRRALSPGPSQRPEDPRSCHNVRAQRAPASGLDPSAGASAVRPPLLPARVALPYGCICCPLLAVTSSARLPAAVGGCLSEVLPLGGGDSSGSPP